MERKTVHIVVHEGLIQEVYIDRPLDVEVAIYDLDTDVPEELTDISKSVDALRSSACPVYKIY